MRVDKYLVYFKEVTKSCIDFVKNNIFFIVFFLYRIIGDYIPGTKFSSGILFVPVLVFLSINSLSIQSDSLYLRKYHYISGLLFATCIASILFCVFPPLPGWNKTTGDYLGIVIVSLSCLQKDYRKLVLMEAISIGSFLIYMISSSLAGVTDTHVIFLRGVIRSGLGYTNPNGLSADLFYLLALIYMGRFIRSRIKEALLVIAMIAFVWYIPNTRSIVLLFFMFIPMLLLEFFDENKGKYSTTISSIKRYVDCFSAIMFPISCIFILGMLYAWHQGNDFALLFESKLGRLQNAYKLILENGISVFGTLFRPEKAGSTDIEYATLLVKTGVFGLATCGAFWTMLSLRCMHSGRQRLLYMLGIFALYGTVERNMLGPEGNIFLFLPFTNISNNNSDEKNGFSTEKSTINKSLVTTVVSMLSTLLIIIALRPFFNRMRTIVQLYPTLRESIFFRVHIMTTISLLIVFVCGLTSTLEECFFKKRTSNKVLMCVVASGLALTCHFVCVEQYIEKGSEEVKSMINSDASALESIISAKTGKLYVDPYPSLYRKRYPQIDQSILYSKDLARQKNATVLTDSLLDGGGSFEKQGYYYAPISEKHAIYTNDDNVIKTLVSQGYHVSPYFSQRIHVDLEKCAKDSYLVYEPSFSGIYIDQTSAGYQSLYVWTNYNTVYDGIYEVTFTCRLLMPEDMEDEEYCYVAINYTQDLEITRRTISSEVVDDNGYAIITIPFAGPTSQGGTVSFSVYGGNVRRLIVEDISYVRTG